jgi:hypothetical protein
MKRSSSAVGTLATLSILALASVGDAASALPADEVRESAAPLQRIDVVLIRFGGQVVVVVSGVS